MNLKCLNREVAGEQVSLAQAGEQAREQAFGAQAAPAQAVLEQTPSAQAPANAAYAATFKRTEKKYCLSMAQYVALMECVQEHLQPDEYPETVVSSLYFDTPDNLLIRRSLEKPMYKEKLRVRSYGTKSPDGSITPVSDQVFVELKKKYKGVVYKRRLSLDIPSAQQFLLGQNTGRANAGRTNAACASTASVSTASASVTNQNTTDTNFLSKSLACVEHKLGTRQEKQVAREIATVLARYENLQPAMVTQCVRHAYKQLGSQLRLTFDFDLLAGRPSENAFDFMLHEPTMKLLPARSVLMEIKQAGGLPLWLVQCLSDNHIYPQSFSKYGTAYKKELKHA